jgi:hypothetical protein
MLASDTSSKRAFALLVLFTVGCAGQIVPKAPGLHAHKTTFGTKYVKNGVLLTGDLPEAVGDNEQARKLAKRSRILGRLSFLPALVAGGCLTWNMVEFDREQQSGLGLGYLASAGCALAAFHVLLVLDHASEAARSDAINTYNNDLLVPASQ